MPHPILHRAIFGATSAFHAGLGFVEGVAGRAANDLTRGALTFEFFASPGHDPASSSFGSCLRLDAVDGFFAQCVAAGIAEKSAGWPRLHAPRLERSGLRIGALVDLDGTLLRLIQNEF